MRPNRDQRKPGAGFTTLPNAYFPACVKCGRTTTDVNQRGDRYCQHCGWVKPNGQYA